MMHENLFDNKTFDLFYKMIEELIDKKIEKSKSSNETSEYGIVLSVTNNEDNTVTKSAKVNIITKEIVTDEIKNNTHEVLNVGDQVRVNAVNGNWNNAYINLKCGISE